MDNIQFPVISGYIQIVEEGVSIPAFWAYPSTNYAYSGIVIVHDRAGLDQDVRAWVRRAAEAGFYCIAPDLFSGQPAALPEVEPHTPPGLEGYGMRWVNAALDVLCNHPHCNGKMGVLGWGAGATLSYESSVARDDLRAAVAYYGDPIPSLKKIATGQVPLLAFTCATASTAEEEQLDSLRVAIGSSPGESMLVAYPQAQMGFMMSSAPEYDETIAREAWDRTIQFLYEHMGTPTLRERRQVI